MNLCFSRRARFLAYGLAGWAVDSLFVFAHTGRRRPSSLLNVPIYGLAELLFEPAHDRLRQRPLALRGALYGAGILGVEYASGRLLRRLVGQVPWNYGRSALASMGSFGSTTSRCGQRTASALNVCTTCS